MKKNINFLVLITIFMTVLIVVMSGCDKKHESQRGFNVDPEKTVSVNYQGYVDACRALYNPLYCADVYNPGLGAEGNASKSVAIFRDEDGNIVVLDPQKVQKIEKILDEDRNQSQMMEE